MLLNRSKFLVDTKWFSKNYQKNALVIIDASWHLPSSNRNAFAEFEAQHIPGAVFFDHDAIVDPDSLLPHALPSESQFSKAVSDLGVNNDRTVVVYDTGGLHAAARTWWMFKVFGHKKVFILDGGLQKWMADGYPTESGAAQSAPRHFKATIDHMALRSADDLIHNLTSQNETIVDARGADRFYGRVAEPREGLKSGHIPNSVNLPFGNLYNADDTLKSKDELTTLFKEAGVTFDKPIITTCGSGITAASLVLALHVMGKRDVSLYDGSWSEWGGLGAEAPVETE